MAGECGHQTEENFCPHHAAEAAAAMLCLILGSLIPEGW